MTFIEDSCTRHSISAAAFRAEAEKGWAPAAVFLHKAGITIPDEDHRPLSEAVHELRFGAEQEPASAVAADTPEPEAVETPPEPSPVAQEPDKPDPWASAIAAVNSRPADYRRA